MSQVLEVVVAGVAQCHRQAVHADRGVCERGVGLGAARGREDLVDLIHRRGGERVELALNQVAGGSAIRGDEDVGGLLEFGAGQNLAWYVEAGHRLGGGVAFHRQQKRGCLIEANAESLGLVDQDGDAVGHLATGD